MDRPLSRLRSLAVRKNIFRYDTLYNYVHEYCGNTLMNAVVEYRDEMEEFFEKRKAEVRAKRVVKARTDDAVYAFYSNAPAAEKRLNNFHDGRLMR